MIENLSQEKFAENLKTKFRVVHDGERHIELELNEVKPFQAGPGEQQGMERFSLFFYGPGEVLLHQQTVRLAHERMGEFYIFIVPVGRDDRGHLYEAVFNYSN
ncbi:MAG TPA: hypothetical protein VEY09_05990 [Pyrinomonadaceae bacterium]|nr:hypothetical protein [Pyrinomonadaceae bacterium]